MNATETKLCAGAESWNAHRAATPDWCPNLKGIDLKDQDLRDYELASVVGLMPKQLAGTSVT